MPGEKKLSRSLEDYLEAILALEKRDRVARVKDIADRLSVQMPSVTGALRHLRDRGFIKYEPNSFIALTEKGLETARQVQRKHTILLAFLKEALLLPPEAAQEQACRIEHSIDAETAKRIEGCTRYIERHIRGAAGIGEERWEQILTGKHPEA